MEEKKLNELELEKVVGGMKKEELVPTTGCMGETNLRKEDGDGGIADLTKTDPAKYEV